MKKTTAIFFIVFARLLQAAAQTPVKTDSAGVNALLARAEPLQRKLPDSAIGIYRRAAAWSGNISYAAGRIKATGGIAYSFLQKGEYDSSLKWYGRADSLCTALKEEYLLLDLYSYYSWALNNQSRFDESLQLCERTLQLAIRKKDRKEIGYAYTAIGLVYVNKSFYQRALENYFLAVNHLEAMNDTSSLCRLYDRISGCYYPLKLYEKSLEYEEKSLNCVEGIDDTSRIRNACFNIGLVLKELGQYNKAVSYYQRAASLNTGEAGDRIMDCRLQYAFAALYNTQGDHARAAGYAQRGADLSRSLDFQSGVSMNLGELGRAYLYQGRTKEALASLKESVSIAQRDNLGEELLLGLDVIRFAEAAGGDMIASAGYDKMYRKLYDSVFNQQAASNIQELESKYRSTEKQNEIIRLQGEKKIQDLSIQRKNILNGILIGSVAMILLVSGLAYRNHKQKQKLQQQRINELETEKQLMATEAVLKGEEKERTRLAKDLHDGLGGMLSGIKYSLNTMKGNLIMTPENAQAFERSMDMLDSSIQEMRRVAHNMMPEALVKFGLDTALKDFCNDINKSGALQVNYQSIGLENISIDQTTSITIYRVVQELINNTMKHAAAKSAIVQVSKTDGAISITVEDDGKGFDTSVLKGARGIGWSNIQSRVEYLKGKLDVQSAPGEGTSVHIELNA
ncbi:MAG TPA: sensor histidine kinase [Ferruginibacter sp.]|nr:sensor histidine kinase [Ferruginibacter sp.]